MAGARASITVDLMVITVDPMVAAHLITPAAAAPFMTAHLTACIPARSVASITEATRTHSPHAAGQAPAVVSMVVEVTPGEATPGEVTDENGARTKVKSIQGV